MKLLPGNGVLIAAGAAVLAALSGLLGYRIGASQATDQALAMAAQQSQQWLQTRAELDRKLGAARVQRDTADAAVAEVESELLGQQTLWAEQQAELALYRRIESPGERRGLALEDLTLARGSAPRSHVLTVTLMQYRARERATGRIRARLQGPPGPNGQSAAWDSASASFDFRFFERVSIQLTPPPGLVPSTLQLLVSPPDDVAGSEDQVLSTQSWLNIPVLPHK